MKHILLLLFFLASALSVSAQSGTGERMAMFERIDKQEEINVRIYPNPATSYIGLDNGRTVKHLVIYNVVGRRVKDFEVNRSDAQYYVGDLPSGMYLVQLLGENQQVLTTKRLNKR